MRAAGSKSMKNEKVKQQVIAARAGNVPPISDDMEKRAGDKNPVARRPCNCGRAKRDVKIK